ncbi:MAG: hypothetical protein FJY92_02505, partial [Candidatus Hydrogenedentes bacterium]|nr:hypothetical protein [Candidatus Hydrogenedentota bacterium]
MRKSVLLSMCMALVMAVALVGCASDGGATKAAAPAAAAKGAGDAAAGIAKALDAWKSGMETKDIAKLGSGISDKFNHYEWGNKQQMLDFLKSQFEQGTLDGAKVNAANAKTTIENGIATVYPVEMTASFGTATIEFKLQQEADGVWRA